MNVGSFDPNQYKYLFLIFFSISLFHLLLCLKKLIFDLIDKFWKNFKVLILLLKTNSPPSWLLSKRLNIPLRDTNRVDLGNCLIIQRRRRHTCLNHEIKSHLQMWSQGVPRSQRYLLKRNGQNKSHPIRQIKKIQWSTNNNCHASLCKVISIKGPKPT